MRNPTHDIRDAKGSTITASSRHLPPFAARTWRVGALRGWRLATALLLAASALGCAESGVGDPYQVVAEQVPSDGETRGFKAEEIAINTGEPTCRSRVGLVFRFEGDPSQILDETPGCENNANCFSRDVIDDCVYCTCRCQAPPDVNAPTCSCPGGFTCVEDIVEVGGDGIRGGYCVREETAELDRCN